MLPLVSGSCSFSAFCWNRSSLQGFPTGAFPCRSHIGTSEASGGHPSSWRLALGHLQRGGNIFCWPCSPQHGCSLWVPSVSAGSGDRGRRADYFNGKSTCALAMTHEAPRPGWMRPVMTRSP